MSPAPPQTSDAQVHALTRACHSVRDALDASHRVATRLKAIYRVQRMLLAEWDARMPATDPALAARRQQLAAAAESTRRVLAAETASMVPAKQKYRALCGELARLDRVGHPATKRRQPLAVA